MFGRPSSLLGTRALAGTVVLCTNPAALSGGTGQLDTIFPSNRFSPTSATPPHTVWAEIRGSYGAQCSAANDAHVLHVTSLGGAPAPKELPDRTWGLHLLDPNIALGNLVDVVRQESATFSRATTVSPSIDPARARDRLLATLPKLMLLGLCRIRAQRNAGLEQTRRSRAPAPRSPVLAHCPQPSAPQP